MEVMIRLCVGEKGSRSAITEVWCNEDEAVSLIFGYFLSDSRLSLAQIFDEYGNFIKQYTRI